MRKCKHCGSDLVQIRSVASDPHDEPFLYCPCWPTDWAAVLMQIVIIGAFIAVLVLAVRLK